MQGNLWECKVFGTRNSGKTFQAYKQEIERLNKENKELDKICVIKSRYIDKKDLEIKQKDLEIERLNNIINKLDKLIEQCSKRDYYFKYNGKYLKSEIINDLKTIRGVDKE